MLLARRSILNTALAGLLLLTSTSVALAQDLVIDDADGNPVTISDATRVATLGGVFTETAYALGAQDQVAAVDASSFYPPEALEEKPGTYFLTDVLARTFEHTVMKELGLDRHPELRDDYFGNYRRVIWLAQRPTLGTKLAAERAAMALGLPLEIREVGNAGLERGLAQLVST